MLRVSTSNRPWFVSAVTGFLSFPKVRSGQVRSGQVRVFNMQAVVAHAYNGHRYRPSSVPLSEGRKSFI